MPSYKKTIEEGIYLTQSNKYASYGFVGNKKTHRTFNTIDEAKAFRNGQIELSPVKSYKKHKTKPEIKEIKVEAQKESPCVVIIAKDARSIKTILADMDF